MALAAVHRKSSTPSRTSHDHESGAVARLRILASCAEREAIARAALAAATAPAHVARLRGRLAVTAAVRAVLAAEVEGRIVDADRLCGVVVEMARRRSAA